MKIAKYTAAVIAISALALGCKNLEPLHNAVYVTGTEESAETRLAISGPAEMGITVTCSERVTSDVTVGLELRPDLIDAYNNSTGNHYQTLPDGSYSLSGSTVTISTTKTVSSAIKLSITDVSGMTAGAWYCVPVGITSVQNNTYPVLEASRTMYVLITKQVATTALQGTSLFYNVTGFLTATDLAALPQVTYEVRALASAYRTTDPFICSLIGIEENFLLRMGDVTIGMDQLQLAGGKFQVASNSKIALNRWYHFAVVYDGQKISIYIDGRLDASRDAPRGPINLTDFYPAVNKDAVTDNKGFHIGYSAGGRYWNGMISEARVWSRALTPNELKNNMCYVDPTSDGLVAYWRLDQASGVNAVDLTGHGYTATARGSGTRTNIKCPN